MKVLSFFIIMITFSQSVFAAIYLKDPNTGKVYGPYSTKDCKVYGKSSNMVCVDYYDVPRKIRESIAVEKIREKSTPTEYKPALYD